MRAGKRKRTMDRGIRRVNCRFREGMKDLGLSVVNNAGCQITFEVLKVTHLSLSTLHK